MSKPRREVDITKVASALPVDTWFDKHEFSSLTGIKVNSCNQRLQTMVDNHQLLCIGSQGVKAFYKMTAEMQATMLTKEGVIAANAKREFQKKDIDKLLFSTKFF